MSSQGRSEDRGQRLVNSPKLSVTQVLGICLTATNLPPRSKLRINATRPWLRGASWIVSTACVASPRRETRPGLRAPGPSLRNPFVCVCVCGSSHRTCIQASCRNHGSHCATGAAGRRPAGGRTEARRRPQGQARGRAGGRSGAQRAPPSKRTQRGGETRTIEQTKRNA